MERSFFFKNAVWVGGAERAADRFTVLRGRLRKILSWCLIGFIKTRSSESCSSFYI